MFGTNFDKKQQWKRRWGEMRIQCLAVVEMAQYRLLDSMMVGNQKLHQRITPKRENEAESWKPKISSTNHPKMTARRRKISTISQMDMDYGAFAQYQRIRVKKLIRWIAKLRLVKFDSLPF